MPRQSTHCKRALNSAALFTILSISIMPQGCKKGGGSGDGGSTSGESDFHSQLRLDPEGFNIQPHVSIEILYVGYDLFPGVRFSPPDLEKTTDFVQVEGCFEDPKCDRSDSPRVYANVASNHEIIPVNRAGNWYFRFRGCMYSDVSKGGRPTKIV